jgi:hypothetical protein
MAISLVVKEVINHEIQLLGISSYEKKSVSRFIFTALGWIFRRDIELTNFIIPGWSTPTRC